MIWSKQATQDITCIASFHPTPNPAYTTLLSLSSMMPQDPCVALLRFNNRYSLGTAPRSLPMLPLLQKHMTVTETWCVTVRNVVCYTQKCTLSSVLHTHVRSCTQKCLANINNIIRIPNMSDLTIVSILKHHLWLTLSKVIHYPCHQISVTPWSMRLSWCVGLSWRIRRSRCHAGITSRYESTI